MNYCSALMVLVHTPSKHLADTTERGRDRMLETRSHGIGGRCPSRALLGHRAIRTNHTIKNEETRMDYCTTETNCS